MRHIDGHLAKATRDTALMSVAMSLMAHAWKKQQSSHLKRVTESQRSMALKNTSDPELPYNSGTRWSLISVV